MSREELAAGSIYLYVHIPPHHLLRTKLQPKCPVAPSLPANVLGDLGPGVPPQPSWTPGVRAAGHDALQGSGFCPGFAWIVVGAGVREATD